MIGKQFLAITTSIYQPNCINTVEILSVLEETYFDEDSFFKSGGDNDYLPELLINYKSKYLVFLVVDVKTRKMFRVCEYDLRYETTGCDTKTISKMIKDIKEEIRVLKLRDKEFEKQNEHINEIDDDIHTHLHNLKKLGYTGDDIKERLKEFVDEKYPDLGLKIEIKKI